MGLVTTTCARTHGAIKSGNVATGGIAAAPAHGSSDLWQIHEVVYYHDPARHNSAGGAVEALADAVKKGVIRAADAIRYAMSLPVAVTESGIDSLELLQENLRTARAFMSSTERLAFENQCAIHATDGRFELYKTTAKFEGPPGREQHGFPPKRKWKADCRHNQDTCSPNGRTESIATL